jgi:hypothetical protein
MFNQAPIVRYMASVCEIFFSDFFDKDYFSRIKSIFRPSRAKRLFFGDNERRQRVLTYNAQFIHFDSSSCHTRLSHSTSAGCFALRAAR